MIERKTITTVLSQLRHMDRGEVEWNSVTTNADNSTTTDDANLFITTTVDGDTTVLYDRRATDFVHLLLTTNSLLLVSAKY